MKFTKYIRRPFTKYFLIIELIIVLIVLLLLFGCNNSNEQKVYVLDKPLGVKQLQEIIPRNNPLTIAKVDLGRKLFFDERLSIDATVSCAFCHNPLLGFSDGRYLAMGVFGLKGKRNSSTLINNVFNNTFFWDGRASSIEETILEHLVTSSEMNNSIANVISNLDTIEYYNDAFREVFNTAITPDGIAKSIASFVRTIVSGNSPYDKFNSGDQNAISESAKRGVELFNSEKTNCSVCHLGQNFTDDKFHNNGAGSQTAEYDLGRFYITKNDTDKGRFRTPTLRDIARTSPFMHDGSLKALGDVIDFYNSGGTHKDFISNKVKPLNLSDDEKDDLANFLRTLSGTNLIAINVEKQIK